jgi:hypothetical protein
LKVPGTKDLKLQQDEWLSNFALNFNLRRYTEVAKALGGLRASGGAAADPALLRLWAGAHTPPLFGSS